MPRPPIIDPESLDCSKILYTREQIYKVLPQRHEFSQLDGIIQYDPNGGTAAGFRDVKPDEWWCRGHMPGQPLFPGVLMVETGAHLAAFVQHLLMPIEGTFLGFGGIDDAKFRGAVVPPCRIILLGKIVEARPRRFIYDIQSFVEGTMVFEGQISGMPLKAN